MLEVNTLALIYSCVYVYRLKIMLQETTKPQHIHAEERWPQVVNALWKHLPHFKVESYRHDMLMVSLPGQYGFPKEELEPNSEEELLMNDTEKVSEIGKEGSDSDQDELSEESKFQCLHSPQPAY